MLSKPCKYCKKTNHSSLMCFFKPRKALNKKGKTYYNRTYVRGLWILENPAYDGYWTCYLQIAPLCPKQLDMDQLTIDHVEPVGSNPHKRYDLKNFRPACIYCNGLKGSRSLESLAQEYPHLQDLVIDKA